MTQSKASEKRGKIHSAIRAAALHEFASKGLDGTSTQLIAKRAEISKAQLHYYIQSKDALYEEILVSVIQQWDIDFFSAIADEDPQIAISSYIELKIKHAIANPIETRLLSQEIASGAPVLSRHWHKSKSVFLHACGVIEGWIEAGKIEAVDPMLFQMELWAVTQHFADYEVQVRFFLGLGPDEPLDEAWIIQHAQNLFLRSLGLSRREPLRSHSRHVRGK